ncbi:hypothetical protein [Haloferula sargassicola]|uniref:Uncharacterized protein n=1 Tax=Haloferula sargassicola TaxID=490096 RepID=A0ABP9ULU7_9BACT
MMSAIAKLALVALAAAGFSSCVYDPYGMDYSSSYGYSGGTTFVQTSSSRWLYDPSVRCYYDVQRSLYYDPFLYGYYPSGYCPRPIYHAPHPYGWNGHGACPTPRDVRYHQLSNYRQRVDLLRQRNYDWAQKVRIRQDAAVANWQRQQAQRASAYRQQTNARRPGVWTPDTVNARQQSWQQPSRNNRSTPNAWSQRLAQQQQANREAAARQRSHWQQQQAQRAQQMNQRQAAQQARRQPAPRLQQQPRVQQQPQPQQRKQTPYYNNSGDPRTRRGSGPW